MSYEIAEGDGDMVTVTISRSALRAAINCVESRANDLAEPERYREWYGEALAELTKGVSGG